MNEVTTFIALGMIVLFIFFLALIVVYHEGYYMGFSEGIMEGYSIGKSGAELREQ